MPAGDTNVKITIEYKLKGQKAINQAKKDIGGLGKTVNRSQVSMKKDLASISGNITALGGATAGTQKKMSKSMDGVNASTVKVGKTTKQTNAAMQHGMSSTMGSLESLGNRFRYLSLVVGTASVLMVTGIKNFTQASMEAEEAMLGLSAESNAWGRDFSRAEGLVQKMTDTGLIPFNRAAEIVRNLMGTGLDIDITEKAIEALMDRAVVSREQQYSYADAIVATTRGIRYQREQLADATLIQGLFNLANEEASRVTGKTTAQLTKLEKAYAVANVVIQESEKYTGMTENAQKLLVGALGTVSAAIFDLKRALGDALKPIIGPFAELISKLSKALQFLVERMSGVVGMVIMTTAVMTGLFAVLATVGAILPMLTTGFAGVKIMLSGISIMSGLATMSLAKFALVSMGITAGISILVYTVLKLTGAWDRYAQGFENVMAGMRGANDAMKDLGKVHTEVTDTMSASDKKQMEARRIQHQRRLEDLDEELKREISKGLWADQIKIKDLKKRIKRENEDWNRYLSDKESGQEDMSSTIADLMAGESLAVEKEVEKMKMAWKDYIDWLSKWETWRDTFETIGRFFSKMGKYAWDGIKSIVDVWTNPDNWKEFWDITKIVFKAAKDIGAAFLKGFWEVFKELPTSVQAAFAGITTFLALTWFPTIIGLFKVNTLTMTFFFTRWKNILLGYFATIKAAWLGLAATISTPIALAIVVTGAWYALQKIRDQVTGLKSDIDGLSETSARWEEMMTKIQERYERGEITREQYLRYMREIQEGQSELSQGIQESQFGWGSIWEGLTTPINQLTNPWGAAQYAEGGVVPGSIGTPQPAIVHGGETIIPAGQSAQSSITININNPIVREQQDIQRIANAVSQVMGQKAKWAKMS